MIINQINLDRKFVKNNPNKYLYREICLPSTMWSARGVLVKSGKWNLKRIKKSTQ